MAKSALSNAGVSYTTRAAPAGALAQVRIGDSIMVDGVDATGQTASDKRAARTAFEARLRAGLTQAGYPIAADPAQINFPLVFAVLALFIVAATALYGPQAAALVELFPTRIRYTALSLPYHIGTGWFGGLLPATVFAINTATGNIYSGLWFPTIVTAIAATIFFFFWPETRDRDIHS
jgi:hypothetical protein